MSEEKVTFDSGGRWNVGAPVQEMDVRETGGTMMPKPGKATFVAPPAPTSPTSPTVGAKKFDLSSLKKSAGVQAAPADEPAPVQEKQEPAAEPSPVKEEPVPVEEPKAEEQPAAVDVASTAEEAEEEKKEEVAEEVVPEVGEAPVEPVAETPKQGFDLHQLGLLAQRPEAAKEEKEEVMPDSVKKMDLETSAMTETVAPSVTEEEAMSFAEDTPFEVVPLDTILRMLHVDNSAISDWFGRIAREYSKRPTAIFKCGFHPNLRVYSATFKARSNAVYLTLGVGKEITVCAYDGRNGKFKDASGEISIDGSCAIISGMPVASCSQRSREAQSL